LPSTADGYPAAAWGVCAWQNLTPTDKTLSGHVSSGSGNLNIDASRAVPTSYENRPASISAAAYMTY
jgi:hypothetical protein